MFITQKFMPSHSGGCRPALVCLPISLHRFCGNTACQPELSTTTPAYIACEREGFKNVHTEAHAFVQMADADPPPAGVSSTLEKKIAALEKAIATEEEEMKNAGMTLTDRITALKPDKERLAALEMQKAIAMRGTPALCLAHNALPCIRSSMLIRCHFRSRISFRSPCVIPPQCTPTIVS